MCSQTVHGPITINTMSNHRRCTCAPRWHHKGTRLPDLRSSPAGSIVQSDVFLLRGFTTEKMGEKQNAKHNTECHEKPLPQMRCQHTIHIHTYYIYIYVYIIYNIIYIYITHQCVYDMVNDVRTPARVRNSSRCQIHRRESWCSSASESSRIGAPICRRAKMKKQNLSGISCFSDI